MATTEEVFTPEAQLRAIRGVIKTHERAREGLKQEIKKLKAREAELLKEIEDAGRS